MEQRPSIWLEVDVATDGIAGRLHDGDRPPLAFSGWLELVAAIEAARRQNTTAAAGQLEPPSASDPR
jgi:hypothetical protein